MVAALPDWIPFEAIEALAASPLGVAGVAMAFLALTASAYASGVPGTLLPLSFTSGAVLGGALGMLAVATGAMIGSLILYFALERGSHAALRLRYADKLKKLEALASRRGIAPIIVLRLAGLPHIAVTALCALAGIGIRRYFVATAVGVLPAIALSSLAGASL